MAFQMSRVGFFVTSSRASKIILRADPEQNGLEKRDKVAKEIKLPKTGYFSLADPTSEVYSKSTEPFDPRKKGGRYKNEFIWNTNWQVSAVCDALLKHTMCIMMVHGCSKQLHSIKSCR
jgi:hypothetical protein